MIFSSILPACATSEIPLYLPHSVLSFLWSTLMMASFHCRGTSPPPPNANDDVEQSLSQGGITVEGDLEQLDGNSIRSNGLSVAKERMASVNSCIVV